MSGSHLHPIFDPLDREYDGMILGLLYLLQLAPGSVLILPDSATLLHILTARFFLRFRWVPGHRNPSESLLYYGNCKRTWKLVPIWHAPLYTPRPSTPSSGDVAPNPLLPPLSLNWVGLSSTFPVSLGAPWCSSNSPLTTQGLSITHGTEKTHQTDHSS